MLLAMGNEAQAEIDSLRERLAAAEAVAAEVARIKAINADLEARNALLELQNEKMRRTLFGQRSERTRHLIDQMELTFEECETAASEDEALAALAAAKTNVAPFERKRPARKALPEHLPRERVVIAAPDACPCCGSDRLCKLGEDITETLEVVPRQWKVVQTVREKFSCRDCEKIAQPPAPFHVTPRGLFGPSFLAMLLFEKFGAHQPLNRQRDRYVREGVDLSLSTLADQVGTCTAALMPLYLLIEAHVLAAERLHGDDTTVPVLAKTKTDTGRIWTYVRDDRPFGGPAPPAAIFHYSRDRRGEHPVGHLRGWRGILQADAYAGYNALFHGGRLPAPLTRALCWSHARRYFFELADIAAQLKKRRKKAVISPLAVEAVRRIDAIFDIERAINGRPAQERHALRQELSAPLVADLEEWMRDNRAKLSKNSDVAEAMDYMLKAWPAFAAFLDDGRICLTNNAAERALRGIATTDSYYTSSSNVRKQGLLVFHFDATRASVTRELGHFVLFQVRGSDLVRRIGYNLLGREHALLDQSTDPMGSNPKLFGGFGQREPLSILFGGSVAVDFVDSAQRADTARCPGLALSGLHSHPVESGGNVCIGPPGGHGADDGKGGFGRTLAMFACFGFANAQLRMLATFPVDRQNDFTLLFIDISDDIGHERAEELLTTTHVDVRRAPSGLQVGGNASKIGRRRGQIDLSRLGQTRFIGFNTPERCFPAILKLGSDQAVIRVAGSIATFSERCLVSGLLQVQLHHAVPFFQIIPMRPISFHCGLDRHRRHGSQYLFAYGRVDARCAKSHASWLGQHLVDTFAAVIGMTRRPARIDNAQPSSTSAAGEQAREQRAATTTRLDAALLSERVDGDMALVPLKLTPIDIAFVMILEQHFPRSKGLAVAVTFACPAIDNLGSLLAFTIDIDPSVEGVLQDRNNASIANRHPVEGHRFAAVRRAGKMEIVSCQRNQHLAGAAKLAETRKDEADRLLYPDIGIQPQAVFAVPDIADRNTEAQFSPPCLGARRVKHACSQNAKLKLADAALHAQQQSIVWSTGIVYPVEIDHARFNQATQLQKVVPVPAITGKARCVQAKHRANLARVRTAEQYSTTVAAG